MVDEPAIHPAASRDWPAIRALLEDAGLPFADLEARARTSGITELWLLTNDAERFFLRHGYAFAERGEAPAAIVTTEEFAGLCPASAHLMRKRLAAR